MTKHLLTRTDGDCRPEGGSRRTIGSVRCLLYLRFLSAVFFVSIAAVFVAGPSLAGPQAKTLHVVLKGQDHHPLVGKKWHYSVTVTDAATGKPVACKIHLLFTLSGVAVPGGEIGVHVVKKGFWQETFGTPGSPPFPAAARGVHLVILAIVTAKGYATAKATWAVVVK